MANRREKMNPGRHRYFRIAVIAIALTLTASTWAAEQTVATSLYARIGNGYKREKAQDGSFKPEYYALSNGGRIFGTMSDLTVDRIKYPEVANIAMRFLATQNYLYAQTKEQAKLLLVLNWGSTLAPNGVQKSMNIASTQAAIDSLRSAQATLNASMTPSNSSQDHGKIAAAGFGRSIQFASNDEIAVAHTADSVENQFYRMLADDRVRDQLNERNAKVLGYMDELADSSDIRRYAGGGDRYSDAITDVEESRYYIVISAYDFTELTKNNTKKLLWQIRVSVPSPGNTFDDSVVAMMKSAAKYFGQDSGRLKRLTETKGTVEMGDTKYLGEAAHPIPTDESSKEKE